MLKLTRGGLIVVTCGKHKGESIQDVWAGDPGWLYWLLKKNKLAAANLDDTTFYALQDLVGDWTPPEKEE